MADSRAPTKAAPLQTRTIDEQANHCFGCGPENPQGLKLRFVLSPPVSGETLAGDLPTVTASSIVTLTRLHEGPPGHIHGGIIATLLDEAMSKLNGSLGVLAMTRNLSVDYLHPSPLGVPLRLVARHLRREGRKIFHAADLTDQQGTVLARAEGFFLQVSPALLAKAMVER